MTWEESFDALLAKADIGAESQVCLDCHRVTSPKMMEQWANSRHAIQGVDCLACHEAQAGEWDAVEHFESTRIATNPTTGDCATCHKREYKEFSQSKHGTLSMVFFSASFDRNVFEPTIATKRGALCKAVSLGRRPVRAPVQRDLSRRQALAGRDERGRHHRNGRI
jgi:hypothetical protein